MSTVYTGYTNLAEDCTATNNKQNEVGHITEQGRKQQLNLRTSQSLVLLLGLPLLLLNLLPVVQAIDHGNQQSISSEFSHRMTGRSS